MDHPEDVFAEDPFSTFSRHALRCIETILVAFDACYLVSARLWALRRGLARGSPSPVGGDETLSRSPWSRSNGRSFYRCATLSDREAAAARVPPLRPDVLVGIEPAETPEDGLRYGHLRDALLLPVLPLQIEDRSELPQAPALGAQHQVDVALGRHPPPPVSRRPDVFDSSVIATSPRGIRPKFFSRSEPTRESANLDGSFAEGRASPRSPWVR